MEQKELFNLKKMKPEEYKELLDGKLNSFFRIDLIKKVIKEEEKPVDRYLALDIMKSEKVFGFYPEEILSLLTI